MREGKIVWSRPEIVSFSDDHFEQGEDDVFIYLIVRIVRKTYVT